MPSSYQAMLRADLASIREALQPKTIACIELPELSFVPLEPVLQSGGAAWFVDCHAGRVAELLGAQIARFDPGGRACLACHTALDGREVCATYVANAADAVIPCKTLVAIPRSRTQCMHFAPGRRLRVINGDARRGRGTGFSTRMETVVATAASPHAAVHQALVVCDRSAELDVPLPIDDGSIDLVISVLGPSRLMEQTYGYFDQLMTRRFGAWITDASPPMLHEIEELQLALLRTQLDAHVGELARITRPQRGRVYYATLAMSLTPNGGWSLDRFIAECLEKLSASFDFDFEVLPAETFMRRCDHCQTVLQSALLRPRPKQRSAT